MEIVIDFPHGYKHAHTHVSAVIFPHGTSEEYGNADFLVELKDGRRFAFTAFTLADVKKIMERDELRFFVTPGLILVEAINQDLIIEAIDYLLRYAGDPLSVPFEHYGILQR